MNEDPKSIAELRKRIAELEQADAAKEKRLAELEFQNGKMQSALETLKLQVVEIATCGNK